MNPNISLINLSGQDNEQTVILNELQNFSLKMADFSDLEGEELIKYLQMHVISEKPDLVIFIEKFDGQSLYPLEFIKNSFVRRIKALIVGSSEDFSTIYASLKSRCNGFINRKQVSGLIKEAVETVLLNEFFMDPKLFSRVVKEFQKENNTPRTVTDKEKHILKFLAKGMMDGEIASSLKVTQDEVRMQIAEISDKFKLNSRTDAVLFAIRELNLHN